MQSQICRLHIYKCWFIYIIIAEFNRGIQRWKIHNVSPLPSYDLLQGEPWANGGPKVLAQ